ncbi:ScbR family autoregulator-binding transcription factor [Microbacterium sp. No. 7]|uniref:ScbR family autoregulator-binding transcription factor n=1 Tax=Microbacterium sp. No. 7 TaxID=1714373 RepID=UPI0006ED122A|nr:ScbR family autoregulator-binding transcription factor [Microbacterium sp. No. 7]ALJ18436.1 hypothetical protein AOA12_00285 [Microbacterium sp. No. 7]
MTMQARAVETRRAIVRAAADVFVAHGFAGASLSEIAARAGVTKGALYFHFPSKTALASAMIQAQQDANAQLENAVRAHDGDHLDLLESMTKGLAQRLVDDPTLRAAMRLAVERGEGRDEVISETYETWERLVADVAARARARGELAAHVDPAQLARFLVAAFTGLQTVSLVASGLDDLQGRVEGMWGLLRAGLSPARPS